MNKKSNLSGGQTSTGLEHEESLTIYFYSVPGLVEFAQNLKIALVVIFMLDDMIRDSLFLPYYRILPKQISNFPIFWNKKTRSLLKGSPMSRKIQDRINNFVQDYKIICNCCDGFEEEYSFNDFLFIRILVGSRNFGIRIDGVKRVAMVPFSDMLNHHQSPNISWFYDNNKKTLIVYKR